MKRFSVRNFHFKSIIVNSVTFHQNHTTFTFNHHKISNNPIKPSVSWLALLLRPKTGRKSTFEIRKPWSGQVVAKVSSIALNRIAFITVSAELSSVCYLRQSNEWPSDEIQSQSVWFPRSRAWAGLRVWGRGFIRAVANGRSLWDAALGGNPGSTNQDRSPLSVAVNRFCALDRPGRWIRF